MCGPKPVGVRSPQPPLIVIPRPAGASRAHLSFRRQRAQASQEEPASPRGLAHPFPKWGCPTLVALFRDRVGRPYRLRSAECAQNPPPAIKASDVCTSSLSVVTDVGRNRMSRDSPQARSSGADNSMSPPFAKSGRKGGATCSNITSEAAPPELCLSGVFESARATANPHVNRDIQPSCPQPGSAIIIEAITLAHGNSSRS